MLDKLGQKVVSVGGLEVPRSRSEAASRDLLDRGSIIATSAAGIAAEMQQMTRRVTKNNTWFPSH